MASIYTFSDGVVDFGKRLADVADAVQGRGNRQGGGGARWLILPAAGAGLYALAKNRTFARQARSVMDQAKERASDLPEDLVGRVQQVTRGTASRRTASSRTGSQRRRKTGSQRRRTTGNRRR